MQPQPQPPQPFVLYSALYDHAEFIRGVTTCGFSGMLWTPELRHAVSPEDYLRRLQAMVLSPQMLLNIWSMPHPPGRQLRRELNSAGEFYPEEEQLRLLATDGMLVKRPIVVDGDTILVGFKSQQWERLK